jgi:hypothetical protein
MNSGGRVRDVTLHSRLGGEVEQLPSRVPDSSGVPPHGTVSREGGWGEYHINEERRTGDGGPEQASSGGGGRGDIWSSSSSVQHMEHASGR